MKAHFVRIGAAGMSAIATVLLQMGEQVSGSDLKESHNTLALGRAGATVTIGHEGGNIGDADVVVVSSAVRPDNPEIAAAKSRGVPVIARAEMLARLCDGVTTIAVAGTHGKTTTTSMISMALETAGYDPSYVIGGELNDSGASARFGRGGHLVAEADESDASFLKLRPEAVVLTNVEPDHLDFFSDAGQVEDAFVSFLSLIPEGGRVFFCGDDPGARACVERAGASGVSYGLGETCEVRGVDVAVDGSGSRFEVVRHGEVLGVARLAVPGSHNVLNALGTMAVCVDVGASFGQVAGALERFGGVKRRFQPVGESQGVSVVDDYAHHPTEIAATLQAARGGDWRRVVCVFQPHRYTRTHALAERFGGSFKDADLVLLTDVYSAGEDPIPGVSGKTIVDSITRADPGRELMWVPKKSDICGSLTERLRRGDLVITMGAGDIWTVGEELLDALKE